MLFPERILILEKEETFQRYLKDIFKKYMNTNIEIFDSPKDALESIRKEYYDMVLLDTGNIDGIDGVSLSKTIKHFKDIPIVFMTGDSTPSLMKEIIDTIPYGFIFKPFSENEIVYTIQLAYKNFQDENKRRVEYKKYEENLVKISNIYTFDLSKKRLYKEGKPMILDIKYEKLLEILCKNIDHIVSHESIARSIWNDTDIKGSSLRTHIYRLKKKFSDLPITSCNKFGYVLQRVV